MSSDLHRCEIRLGFFLLDKSFSVDSNVKIILGLYPLKNLKAVDI